MEPNVVQDLSVPAQLGCGVGSAPLTFSGGFSLNNPSAAASPPAFVGGHVLSPH